MAYCLFAAKEAMKVARSGQVYQVVWQPGQGDLLACATSSGGTIINMERPETEAVQLGTGETKWVAWSQAGDLLLTLGEQDVVWNSQGARVATLPRQHGNWEDRDCVYPQFNVSGSLLAITRGNISMSNRYCDVFDTRTGVLQHSLEYSENSAFCKGGESLVWKDDFEFFISSFNIKLWRVGQAEPLQKITGFAMATTMAFNQEKGIMAFGDMGGTVRLWSSAVGITTLTGDTGKVLKVIWKAQNSGILASYSIDGQIRIWDAISKTNLHMYDGYIFYHSNLEFFHCISQISFSPDGRFFAVAGGYENVKVVKVSTGETVAECEEYGIAVSWSQGSNKIAVKTIPDPNNEPELLDHVEEDASVYNLENLMGIKLKAMSMKRVASLLERNLTNGKEEVKDFLTNERIPKALITGVCSYFN